MHCDIALRASVLNGLVVNDPAMGEALAEVRMLAWYQKTAEVMAFEEDRRRF